MIEIKNLCFSYSHTPFIEDMSFDVKDGELFGFLGPSGAGKSTLQKILIGMLLRYSGSVKIAGSEVRLHDNTFYEQIGVDFEYPTLYEKLTARQNLHFFASLYAAPARDLDELLSSVELLHDADKKVSEFSKGMKSRLNFVKALLHNPRILFLDEPTSGLDPANARLMKDLILAEKAKGTTILLTTHNMNDAAELCDRVAFIVDGHIRALDTPHNLIMQKGANKLRYSYLCNGKEVVSECPLNQSGTDACLRQLIEHGQLLTIHSTEPNLGDIFMDVTGRRLA